jgi:hypothetical protein
MVLLSRLPGTYPVYLDTDFLRDRSSVRLADSLAQTSNAGFARASTCASAQSVAVVQGRVKRFWFHKQSRGTLLLLGGATVVLPFPDRADGGELRRFSRRTRETGHPTFVSARVRRVPEEQSL